MTTKTQPKMAVSMATGANLVGGSGIAKKTMFIAAVIIVVTKNDFVREQLLKLEKESPPKKSMNIVSKNKRKTCASIFSSFRKI